MPEESTAITALRLMMGHWVAQCVSVACELRLPDLVAAGRRAAGELASACGTDPGATLRLLRALAALGILAQTGPDAFEATPLTEQFRQDGAGLGPYGRFITGPESYRAWGGLLEAVRRGRPAFDEMFGEGFFDYGRRRPDRGLIFDRGMTASTTAAADEIAEALDLSGVGTIVDVGGGHGRLLSAILRRNPDAKGILFDLPGVVARASPVLEEAGVADRCELAGGDFMEGVPAACDAYVLKAILHDWDDERARRILTNCRTAMNPDGRVVVVERVIPERVEATFVDQRATLMDLNMLVLLTGRERTEEEFRELVEAAGLTLRRRTPLSELSILETVCVVRPQG